MLENWSEFYFHGKGDNKDIEEFVKKVEEKIDGGVVLFDSAELYDAEISIYPNNVYISGEGKWSAPMQDFSRLAIKHKLSAEISDMEPGSDCFEFIGVADGQVAESFTVSYTSKKRYDYEGYGIDDILNEYEGILSENYWQKREVGLVELFREYGMTPDEVNQRFDRE